MSNKYTITNSTEKTVWLNFINKHPNGNFFQTPQFIEFISKTNNSQPVTLFAQSSNKLTGVLCGVIQKEGKGAKSFFSSRLIIWGAPLVENEQPEITELLINTLINKYSRKSIYIEFRNLFSQERYKNIFQKQKFSFLPYLNYIVKTDNEVDVRKRISKSKIRQIKSSIKNGVEIVEASSLDEIKVFYNILFQLYKEKVKKPLPDFTFFEEFYKIKELGKVLLTKKEEKVLGGIVCPIFNDKTIYEWFVCGIDGLEKGIHPSILATYAPIDYALKNGIQYFDFMGAGRKDDDYGVRDFKSKFGGELVEYGRYIRINKPILYKIGKLGLKILGKYKKL